MSLDHQGNKYVKQPRAFWSAGIYWILFLAIGITAAVSVMALWPNAPQPAELQVQAPNSISEITLAISSVIAVILLLILPKIISFKAELAEEVPPLVQPDPESEPSSEVEISTPSEPAPPPVTEAEVTSSAEPEPAPITEIFSNDDDPLDNRQWVDLVEESVELIDELDRYFDSFDAPRKELADHIMNRLQEILERSGVETIIDDEAYDRQRHEPAEESKNASPGAAIAKTLSPGFAIGRRVFRRARVKMAENS